MASLLLSLEGDGTDRPDFVEPDHKYDCPVCRKILWIPMQTPCGHRLCEPCISNLLLQSDPVLCPVQEEFCEYLTHNPNNFFRDISAYRDILAFLVYCSNRQNGCTETMQWRNLKQHLKECKFALIICPKKNLGCEELLPKYLFEDHVMNKCRFRDMTCTFCEKIVPAHLMQHHVEDECLKVRLDCPYQCGLKGILREQLAVHQRDCPVKPLDCRYAPIGCEVKGSLQQIERHMKDDVQQHLDLTITRMMHSDLEKAELRRQVQETSTEKDLLRSEIDTLSQKFNELATKTRKLEMNLVGQQERVIKAEDTCKEFATAATNIEGHTAQLVAINETLQEQQGKIATLESRPSSAGGAAPLTGDAIARQVRSQERQIAVQDVRLAEIDLRFQVLETATYNGVLLWKIRDYSRRKRDAVDKKTLSLYSQPFYTGRHGYRMCARVYLNGDGMGKGTHLSLFFVVMRGEYDALLPWPFRQKVTMMLQDQDTGRRNLSDSFRPDPTSSSFKQPTSEMNVASGCPLFVQQSVVEGPAYCKNDTIFIKIIVDCTGIHDS